LEILGAATPEKIDATLEEKYQESEIDSKTVLSREELILKYHVFKI
jgi:hypothetical protein